jgi:hypothetical protein
MAVRQWQEDRRGGNRADADNAHADPGERQRQPR